MYNLDYQVQPKIEQSNYIKQQQIQKINNLKENIIVLQNDDYTQYIKLIPIPIDETIITEQNNELKKLIEDLEILNDIMHDMHVLVHDQTETLELIENTTDKTFVTTESIVEQLTKTKQLYKEIKRKRKMIVIGAISGATIGGVIIGGISILTGGIVPGIIATVVGTSIGALGGGMTGLII